MSSNSRSKLYLAFFVRVTPRDLHNYNSVRLKSVVGTEILNNFFSKQRKPKSFVTMLKIPPFVFHSP